MFPFIPLLHVVIQFYQLFLSLAVSFCCYFLLQKSVGLQTEVKWDNLSSTRKKVSEGIIFQISRLLNSLIISDSTTSTHSLHMVVVI